MPEIPYEQLLQAQLGTLIGVLGIVLLLVIGLTLVTVGIPLMKLLNWMASEAKEARKDGADAVRKAEAVQEQLAKSSAALAESTATNTEAVRTLAEAGGAQLNELKAQTTTLAALPDGFKASMQSVSDKAVATVTAQIAAHDQGVNARLEQVEATLAEVRQTLLSVRDELDADQQLNKAHRNEMVTKLDEVLVKLTPAPAAPVLNVQVTGTTEITEAAP
jgi:hypothetical protein